MARITLYVPDHLLQNAKALGDETNWSQVFQTALKAELQRAKFRGEEEDLLAAVDLPGLARRFDQEQRDLYRRGFEIGLERAKRAHYAELRYCENVAWDQEKVMNAMVDDLAFDALLAAEDQLAARYAPPPVARKAEEPSIKGIQRELSVGFMSALFRVWQLTSSEES